MPKGTESTYRKLITVKDLNNIELSVEVCMSISFYFHQFSASTLFLIFETSINQ